MAIKKSNAAAEEAEVVVRKNGKTWSVFVNGKFVEGGFFNRDAALNSADQWAETMSALDPEMGNFSFRGGR